MFDYRDFPELDEFVLQDDRHGWNGNNIDYDGFRSIYGKYILDVYGVDYENSEHSIDELLDQVGVPSGFINEMADPDFPEDKKMYGE